MGDLVKRGCKGSSEQGGRLSFIIVAHAAFVVYVHWEMGGAEAGFHSRASSISRPRITHTCWLPNVPVSYLQVPEDGLRVVRPIEGVGAGRGGA